MHVVCRVRMMLHDGKQSRPNRIFSNFNIHYMSGIGYPLGSNSFTIRRSLFLIYCVWRSARLRFVVFLLRIWLPWDLANLIFPDPVRLKRFAAALFVLIFGIRYSPYLKKNRWRELILHQAHATV